MTDQEMAGSPRNIHASQFSMHEALAESTVQFNLKGEENERSNEE